MTETLEQQSNVRWLQCRLDKGMFSDEIAVTYPPTGNLRKSVFVPRTVVKGDPGSRGKVQVAILRRGDKVFALLPSSQQELVEVYQSDISD
jgi:hypothetical protein